VLLAISTRHYRNRHIFVQTLIVTLLIILIIYTGVDQPVKGAWVEVEGMVTTGYVIEQVTDSAGVFVVEVEPGVHQVSITKTGYQSFIGDLTFIKDGAIGIRLEKLTP